MEEVFKDIPGYEGMYQVSDLGNIKSLERKGKIRGKFDCIYSEKMLSPVINIEGYSKIRLYKNGEYKVYNLSRLVAQSFLGLDINNKQILVCHKIEKLKNGKLDNSAKNLFLGTSKINANDRDNKIRSALGEKCGLSKLKNDDIVNIRKNYRGLYGEQKRLAEQYMVNRITIYNIIHKNTWKHI